VRHPPGIEENENPLVEVHHLPHLKFEMWATHRMEASPEHKNCQEGGGELHESGEKAAILPKSGHFLVKKGSFLGACGY
jgi:hypothetical protein